MCATSKTWSGWRRRRHAGGAGLVLTGVGSIGPKNTPPPAKGIADDGAFPVERDRKIALLGPGSKLASSLPAVS
jgi:hypothetical protein